MYKKKSLTTYIILISLFALTFICGVISLTFAYFGDKKESDVLIDVSKTNITLTSYSLSPDDLIANNTFTKDLTVAVSGDTNIYLRAYATIEMDTLNSLGTKEVREDLIDVTSVTNTVKGTDNKFYYSMSSAPQTVSSNNLTLTFNFKVSSLVNEELYTKQDGTIDTFLKTKITYHLEYCQQEGYADWSNFNVELPFEVEINGSEITVNNSEELMERLEDIDVTSSSSTLVINNDITITRNLDKVTEYGQSGLIIKSSNSENVTINIAEGVSVKLLQIGDPNDPTCNNITVNGDALLIAANIYGGTFNCDVYSIDSYNMLIYGGTFNKNLIGYGLEIYDGTFEGDVTAYQYAIISIYGGTFTSTSTIWGEKDNTLMLNIFEEVGVSFGFHLEYSSPIVMDGYTITLSGTVTFASNSSLTVTNGSVDITNATINDESKIICDNILR